MCLQGGFKLRLHPGHIQCSGLEHTAATSGHIQVCQGQGQPRRSQGGTEQDQLEGPRGVERFLRPVGRCPQVRVGEGEASTTPPLKVQITSTQDFIRRSERRVAELEAERIAESKLLEEARERLIWRPPAVQKNWQFRFRQPVMVGVMWRSQNWHISQ